jgi:hypothetical protein
MSILRGRSPVVLFHGIDGRPIEGCPVWAEDVRRFIIMGDSQGNTMVSGLSGHPSRVWKGTG